jgi:hypothetical protein
MLTVVDVHYEWHGYGYQICLGIIGGLAGDEIEATPWTHIMDFIVR